MGYPSVIIGGEGYSRRKSDMRRVNFLQVMLRHLARVCCQVCLHAEGR